MKTNIRKVLSLSALPVKNRHSSILALFILLGTSCTYDKEELLNPPPKNACDTLNATFAKVQSIMTTKCSTSRCHGVAAAKGGAVLETYDQIKAKADRIKQRALIEKTMPPSSPLSSNEIAVLQCWFDSGMPNN
ncbi:hypothetical protein A4H97_11405 [Niastella yeongjuensis]|uniref:Cytochrome C Planctomycete-type domain-containing protein n=1 Tax=Niastella yeongjuensis TaxID=354355 RepID=A0A1V9E9W2_9BACT|nr:hypothetical protein [Niastella yeongjuensis]OQP42764.1 hypothetical protein A4H97_11405 [Niastella yeongjuensis]SEO52932.1 hypothetical protein SAMN05660816_02948 [Niastella yeongjuensis]